jgi:hypothetical protein
MSLRGAAARKKVGDAREREAWCRKVEAAIAGRARFVVPRFQHRPGERIRLAVDVLVSPRAWPRLNALGVDLVYEAGASESDETWFAAALRESPHAIVSHDYDLGLLCYEHGPRFMFLERVRAAAQAEWIFGRLAAWGWVDLDLWHRTKGGET